MSQNVGQSLVDNGLDFGWGGVGLAYQWQHSWCIAASAFASITENVGQSLVDNGLDFGWGGRQVTYQCQHSCLSENVGL